ncbi:hypothetical protein ACLOJK_007120 [Asimina triloba]
MGGGCVCSAAGEMNGEMRWRWEEAVGGGGVCWLLLATAETAAAGIGRGNQEEVKTGNEVAKSRRDMGRRGVKGM